jgi:DNA-binding response OmpR family regulator
MAKKIVIVEDNNALAEIYTTRLELVGYACYVAYDGVEALETIERAAPDLVLLDLMLPRIAGDEILRRMRESSWGKDIKVYIISNLNEADAPKGLREMGIEGYAVKANLTNDQLDRTVDSILNKVGRSQDVSLEMQPQVPSQAQDIPVATAPPVESTPSSTIQMPSTEQATPSDPAAPHAQTYHRPVGNS